MAAKRTTRKAARKGKSGARKPKKKTTTRTAKPKRKKVAAKPRAARRRKSARPAPAAVAPPPLPELEEPQEGALVDASGIYRVKESILRSQRGLDEDEDNQFRDPTLVVETQLRRETTLPIREEDIVSEEPEEPDDD